MSVILGTARGVLVCSRGLLDHDIYAVSVAVRFINLYIIGVVCCVVACMRIQSLIIIRGV
jgi:hypothetical protein